MARVMIVHQIEHLRFASDATLLAMGGGALLALAVLALVADRRRVTRKSIDSVGFMPWTAIFLLALFLGVPLLAMAAKGWMAP